ncbi:MAG TPA: glutathione S-transferase N-terminal domain-containing protein [Polyangiaceae bacterium]|jgi:GST-like protein|nr:glutathione S-transferase N-terminal domain-containing protein [Polyangiaceae bacterium]
MLDAYVWTTPNGEKLLIALEELGLPHTLKWVNLGKDEQKKPEYLAVNPNNKIPAIVDHEGPDGAPIIVFESGAVLLYLADKAKKLVAASGRERYRALEWMFFNTGGAPLMGQLGYYKLLAKEKDPQAIERFTTETERQFGVLERRLGESRYLVNDEFSIADVQNFTWPRAAKLHMGIEVGRYSNVSRWLDEIEARPTVKRALALKPG